MIDALLDEYSEKAEQTHHAYQQQKEANEPSSTSKSQKHEAQVSDPDTFKSSREQAPKQSYQNEADRKQTRQTTLFETMPDSDTSPNDAEQCVSFRNHQHVSLLMTLRKMHMISVNKKTSMPQS